MHTANWNMDQFRKRFESLRPIQDEEWEGFMKLARPISFRKGQVLQVEGDVWEDVYFIGEGLLRIYYLKDGVEFIRQFFFEGGVFGELASSAIQQPSRLFMDAVEDGKAWLVPWKSIQTMAPFSMMALADSLHHVSNRMASIFLDSPEKRYLELVASRPKVMARIPQYMIASYLGVTPEGLSRLKKRLKKNSTT